MLDAVQVIATALKLPPEQVAGAAELLKAGATVPFLARYRKERTGGLNEEQLYAIKDRLGALVSLEARRSVILSSVKAQDKLTDKLRARIESAPTRTDLEDLYLPYCPHHKSPATAARAQGLEPLAEQILKQEATGNAEELAANYLSSEKGVKEASAALAGARALIAEGLAENAGLRGAVRQLVFSEGKLIAQAAGGDAERGKYATYAHFSEAIAKLPSHRILAVLRGETEKKLKVTLEAPRDKILEHLKALLPARPESAFAAELAKALEECVDRFLLPTLNVELRAELKSRADQAAAELFARNLRSLLRQPPFGPQRVLAATVDRKTGCHVVVLDEQGKLLAHAALPLEKDEEKGKAAREELLKLVREHKPAAVASGNDAEGREADAFLRETLSADPELKGVLRVLVNEAGASAYSASRAARDEFPELPPPTRAAISIGRRLQNPLAELVKIHPKSIGVGQYQHDVDQKVLLRKLEEAVESCVNAVGVDLNAAGPELLTHVSGLGPRLAASTYETRLRQGLFACREDLRKVPGFGPKAFELCAGFLRVHGGLRHLDHTAIHPERYPLVEEMAQTLGLQPKDLLGNAAALAKLDLPRFQNAEIGEFTVRDIVEELKDPGRDPRGPFVPPQFNEGIQDVKDLQEGQVLNGVVTNLTAFGAFVDIGVHQDGLVHVSELSHKFVRDPALLLSVGQPVKVKVLGVDGERKRISLSMKALEAPPAPRPKPKAERPPRPRKVSPRAATAPAAAPPQTAPGQAPAPSAAAREAASAATAPAAAPAGQAVAAAPAAGQATAPAHPPRPERRGPPAGRGPARGPPAGRGPERGPRAGRQDRGDRKDRGDRGPRRREAGPPPAPGKPDYSKFFVRGKRKERRDFGPRRENEASRDDIRQVMRTQEQHGHTLGDLLKKAGLDEGEPKPEKKG